MKTSSTHWQCPTCKMTIVTHVKLSCEPVCNNPLSHSTRNVPMEKVEKNRVRVPRSMMIDGGG